MTSYKQGDIIRYSGGSSALARLESPHAGGWHATHCLGGTLFVSESYPCTLYPACEEDIKTFKLLRRRTLKQQGRTE